MKKSAYDQYIPHLSIDCVIFGYENKELKVLISNYRLGGGSWSLPGGYIKKTESVDAAASRILKHRTGLEDIYLEQFRIFGDENRIVNSPNNAHLSNELRKLDSDRYNEEVIEWITGRFVCVGYYALVDISKVQTQPGEFDDYLEWCSINHIPAMMHDHREIITYALEALRERLDKKLIGFKLLPETFTIKEVQQLYETVYEKSFPINNFQKKMMDLNVLEKLHKKYTGASNTAPYLYKFKKESPA